MEPNTLPAPGALFISCSWQPGTKWSRESIGQINKKIKNGPVSNVVDGCLEHLPWTEVQPSLQRFTDSIQTTESEFTAPVHVACRRAMQVQKMPLWIVGFGVTIALQDNFYVDCHKLPMLLQDVLSNKARHIIGSKTNRLVVYSEFFMVCFNFSIAEADHGWLGSVSIHVSSDEGKCIRETTRNVARKLNAELKELAMVKKGI